MLSMPTSKRRKSRDQFKIKKTRGPEPYSYPVGEWLQNEKGLTAEESEIVRAYDAEAERRLARFRETGE